MEWSLAVEKLGEEGVQEGQSEQQSGQGRDPGTCSK